MEFGDFEGRWLLERGIEDRLAGQAGRFVGVAEFAAAGGGLLYSEEGVLTLGGAAPVRAERRYRWSQEGTEIVVDYPDGRPFHRFVLGGAVAEAEHLCGADTYRVLYDFGAWPVWRAIWDVSGPRKAYRLEGVYRRA